MRPGDPVVDADISDPAAGGQIGKHRDDRHVGVAHRFDETFYPRIVERCENQRVVVDDLSDEGCGVALTGEVTSVKRGGDAMLAKEAGG